MSDEQDLAEMELAHQWETLLGGLTHLKITTDRTGHIAIFADDGVRFAGTTQRADESRGQAIVRALMQAQGK